MLFLKGIVVLSPAQYVKLFAKNSIVLTLELKAHCAVLERQCFWPGITHEMKDYLAKCEVCNAYQSEQPKEPLINHELPDGPWEKIGVDLMFVDGQHYLVTVDYYSDYFELDHMTSTNSETVIKRLKRHFSRHGIPIIVQSDNGPPFNSSMFADFAKD